MNYLSFYNITIEYLQTFFFSYKLKNIKPCNEQVDTKTLKINQLQDF